MKKSFWTRGSWRWSEKLHITDGVRQEKIETNLSLLSFLKSWESKVLRNQTLGRHSLPFDMVSCPHGQEADEGLVSKHACLNTSFFLAVVLACKKSSPGSPGRSLRNSFCLSTGINIASGSVKPKGPHSVRQSKHSVWEAPQEQKKMLHKSLSQGTWPLVTWDQKVLVTLTEWSDVRVWVSTACLCPSRDKSWRPSTVVRLVRKARIYQGANPSSASHWLHHSRQVTSLLLPSFLITKWSCQSTCLIKLLRESLCHNKPRQTESALL